MRRIAIQRIFLTAVLLAAVAPCGAKWRTLSVSPDSLNAPPFETVFQYTEFEDNLRFVVCADTAGVDGEMLASLVVRDGSSMLVSTMLNGGPSDLGKAWGFSMRSDLLPTSTLHLIVDPHVLFPAGTSWAFELGPLTEKLFHVELEPLCPEKSKTLPRDKYDVPDFHILHLLDGEVVEPAK